MCTLGTVFVVIELNLAHTMSQVDNLLDMLEDFDIIELVSILEL